MNNKYVIYIIYNVHVDHNYFSEDHHYSLKFIIYYNVEFRLNN